MSSSLIIEKDKISKKLISLVIILPKHKVDINDSPIIFLAGPISNAPNWQDKAIETITNLSDKIYVASPRRESNFSSLTSESKFEHQLDWERHYLDLASTQGAILFWLPAAKIHDCNRAYARDTRGELGEWRGRLSYDPDLRVIIGGENAFDGIDIIRRNYQAIKPEMEFYNTLDELCKQAISIVLA